MTPNNQKIFLLISPNFPSFYYQFAVELKKRGFLVLGIGDEFPEKLIPELKESLTEYCRVWDLKNTTWLIQTVDYLTKKYGKIDYLESNNEFWLEQDAILRQWFDIKTGLFPNVLRDMQAKSGMKKNFAAAGANAARYHLSDNFESTLAWANEIGFPIFVKPDLGVGSIGTKKIHNEEELKEFYLNKDSINYIFEEFVSGDTVSYDGVVNSKGEIIFDNSECFMVDNAELVNKDLDDYFYTVKEVPNDLREIGNKIIKSFGINSRPFHLEFFRLRKDSNLGKKGDLFALEINLRMGGANVPYVASCSQGVNLYSVFADMIAYDENRQIIPEKKYFACSIGRKLTHKYLNSFDDMKIKYKDNICDVGEFPKEIAADAGDAYVVAKFEKLEELNEFAEYVLTQVKE